MPPTRGLDQFAADHGIDEETGAIRGFSVMELGEISGHRMEADRKTLIETVRLANASVEAADVADRRLAGIKMRLGHPSMSGDAITKTMAVARDFRISEDGRVRSNGQFLEAANPEARRHLTLLAKERPDLFGTSLVVSGTSEKRLNEDGTPATGADGKELLPLFRPTAVHAVDFVDTGAATASGFFSGTTALLSAEAAEQLAKISSRDDFPERIRRFVRLIDIEHPGMGEQLREALALDPGETMDETTQDPAPEPEFDNARALKHLKASGYDFGKTGVEPEETPVKDDGNAVLLKQMADLKADIGKLQGQAEEARGVAAELKLSAYKARLDALTHVDQALREGAAKAVGVLLSQGDTEGAESFVKQYEAMPNMAKMAHLGEEISVGYVDGSFGKVDLSPYKRLKDTEDGARGVIDGDREDMVEAATISQISDASERREARLVSFKARGKGTES